MTREDRLIPVELEEGRLVLLACAAQATGTVEPTATTAAQAASPHLENAMVVQRRRESTRSTMDILTSVARDAQHPVGLTHFVASTVSSLLRTRSRLAGLAAVLVFACIGFLRFFKRA